MFTKINLIFMFGLFLNQLQLMQEQRIAALRDWMVARGCKIHPHLTLPAKINGVQGIATNQPIEAKTLIIAIPSNMILTVTRCYNDPILKKLFLANDDLFDYQASEDAQFNVLCVFMMYHKLNLEQSEWKPYLQTIAEPETAVDWQDADLKGLNKSLIEEVIHVRIQCNKLENQLVPYLAKRKEFKEFGQPILRSTFHYCYRAVMTRCFGYYFNQACLIPIADLINHGCQAIDHQLLNVNFQLQKEFQEGYYPRKEKMNLSLLGISSPEKQNLPFRQKFLIQNNIIEDSQQKLRELDRKKINSYLYEWNSKRLKQGQKLQNLHFCSEDEQEDNDTDQEFQVEQVRELDHCKKTEEQQMKDFMNHFVVVERYVDVENKLNEIQGNHQKQEEKPKEQSNQKQGKEKDSQQVKQVQGKGQEIIDTAQTTKQHESQPHILQSTQNTTQAPQQPQRQTKATTVPNPFSNSRGQGVPIQMVDSSSQQQDEDEQEWGLKQGSYFTMATSSPVDANKQIYNSYGSRTNKFLLIWYGFTYPGNLYDSVTLRLQVQFGQLRAARQIVLDSYIGGQGLSFKKANSQIVKQHQISRQFRLKRSNISDNLLIFLRLYLMNYYKGQDLYKLFVTFPASTDFQLFVFQYYRDIVEALYDRYPIEVIEILKQEYSNPQYESSKFKIKYKIIYLEEQRKLLDINMKAVDVIIDLLKQAKVNRGIMLPRMYEGVPIEVLRLIRKYLIAYQQNQPYILYSQAPPPPSIIPQQQTKQPVHGKQQQQQWQSQQQQGQATV